MGLSYGIQPGARVIANGEDITSTITGRFISLTLTDEVGMASDVLEITLDDSNPLNPVQVPPTGAELELAIGYDGIFEPMGLYICDEIELAGWPGQMVIRARAAVYDKSKSGKQDLQTQKTRSWQAGTKLADMVKKIASEHGLDPKVAQSLQGITLPHIDQADESDINLLIRTAKKYDAIVKPAAGSLVIARNGESKSIAGNQLPTVRVDASDCKSWRMVFSKRETAGMVVAYWNKVQEAKRREVKVGQGEPVRRLRNGYPSEEMALAAARAELQRRERAQKTLSMNLIGSTSLQAEAPLIVSGFRPDVDGEWLIKRVTHRIDASSGYTCDIEAEKPNDTADVDVEVVDAD